MYLYSTRDCRCQVALLSAYVKYVVCQWISMWMCVRREKNPLCFALKTLREYTGMRMYVYKVLVAAGGMISRSDRKCLRRWNSNADTLRMVYRKQPTLQMCVCACLYQQQFAIIDRSNIYMDVVRVHRAVALHTVTTENVRHSVSVSLPSSGM